MPNITRATICLHQGGQRRVLAPKLQGLLIGQQHVAHEPRVDNVTTRDETATCNEMQRDATNEQTNVTKREGYHILPPPS